MKNCCTPSDCSPNDLTGRKAAWYLWYLPIALLLVGLFWTRGRVWVWVPCPRGDGAGLLSKRSPVRATTLLRHRAAVPRGGTLRRALRIWAGRLASRSVSHRLTSAVVPCPMCGDSLGHVPEERIGRTSKPCSVELGMLHLRLTFIHLSRLPSTPSDDPEVGLRSIGQH